MKKIIIYTLTYAACGSALSAMQGDSETSSTASSALVMPEKSAVAADTTISTESTAADTSISTARILAKLASVEFSTESGSCADVLNQLERQIAKYIFDGSTQSWKYKGDILGTVGGDRGGLDDFNLILVAAFKGIDAKFSEDNEADHEAISALRNLCIVYTHVRSWMEAIWNDKNPTNIPKTILQMRKAFLQTDVLKSVLDRAPDMVRLARDRHMEQFHSKSSK